jgi:hypothetical protein
MNKPPRSHPAFYSKSGGILKRAPMDATDYLNANDSLAALLPAVHRMVALQKDCATLLPAMFGACDIVHFEGGNLVLAVPNAAVAARLKQQLPKLQDGLVKLGWQVNAIRLKVQVGKIPEKSTTQAPKQPLPATAVTAFAELADALEDTPANAALRQALAAMVARRTNRT